MWLPDSLHTRHGRFRVTVCIIKFAWFYDALFPNTLLFNVTVNFEGRVALLMCSAMVSKMAISSTLAMLTTCTTELVCDEKKKMCAFSTIVWARIWLLTAPFVGATIVFGQLVPQTAFATLSIIGGLLTMCLSSARTLPKAAVTTNLPAELTPAHIWTVKRPQQGPTTNVDDKSLA